MLLQQVFYLQRFSKRALMLLLISLPLLLSACASKITCEGPRCDSDPKTLYNAGLKAMHHAQYTEAITQFEKLAAKYPVSDYTKRSRLELIYTYYQQEEYTLALAEADRYIRLHPRDVQVDYVYYMKGVLHRLSGRVWWSKWFRIDPSERDLSEERLALLAFSDLIHLFPESRYVASAKEQIQIIRHLLAKHELNVAKFYLKRKQYAAAHARLIGLIKQYPDTLYAKEARGYLR